MKKENPSEDSFLVHDRFYVLLHYDLFFVSVPVMPVWWTTRNGEKVKTRTNAKKNR